MNRQALRALADCADALARLARAAADDGENDPTALVPLVEAARIAATSIRVIRDGIRAGELPAMGRQRDRAIRRADLDAWIESRRAKPVSGLADDDIERRIARLGRVRTGGAL